MKNDAGFHFSCMIILVFEECFLVNRLIPIAGAQEHFRKLQAQLPDHRSKVIATMAVQYYKLVDALAIENFDDIPQDRELRAWVHVHIKGNIKLSCVYSERNGRKHNNFFSLLPSQAGSFSRHVVGFNNISSIREMI